MIAYFNKKFNKNYVIILLKYKIIKVEIMEKDLEKVILDYLKENRYFRKELLEKKIFEIKDKIEEYLEKEKEIFRKGIEQEPEITGKEIEEESEEFKKEKRKHINESIYSIYLPKVLNENFILLASLNGAPKRIVILKEKEAEFFVFIFNFYKNNCFNNVILREYIDEAKLLLNMEDNIISRLVLDKVLTGVIGGARFVTNIPIQNREDIYQSSEIEKKIYFKIAALNINKGLIKLKEEMKKTEEEILKSNKKISKTSKSIENTKIDTLALLAIFVAIISILYGNIFASNLQSVRSIVITNVSTVACIAFMLGYVEIFIKDREIIKKDFIAIVLIIVSLALIISAYYD